MKYNDYQAVNSSGKYPVQILMYHCCGPRTLFIIRWKNQRQAPHIEIKRKTKYLFYRNNQNHNMNKNDKIRWTSPLLRMLYCRTIPFQSNHLYICGRSSCHHHYHCRRHQMVSSRRDTFTSYSVNYITIDWPACPTSPLFLMFLSLSFLYFFSFFSAFILVLLKNHLFSSFFFLSLCTVCSFYSCSCIHLQKCWPEKKENDRPSRWWRKTRRWRRIIK